MRAEFDRYKDDYVDRVNRSLRFSGMNVDFFTRAKARHLIALARRRFGDLRQVRLLDVGCGQGSLHPHLTGEFGSLTGIDVATETLEQTRQANPGASYQPFDGRRVPFEDGAFDVALAVNVLHHVPPERWLEFIAEMGRVTRRGGMVVVFEHNPYNLLTRYAVRQCEFDKDAVLLSARRLRQVFRKAGLVNCYSRHIIFAPVEGRSAALLDRILGWSPVGAQYFVVANK